MWSVSGQQASVHLGVKEAVTWVQAVTGRTYQYFSKWLLQLLLHSGLCVVFSEPKCSASSVAGEAAERSGEEERPAQKPEPDACGL